MTVVQNYAQWTVELTFPRMSLAKAEAFAAWSDQLRGSYGTFLFVPPHSVSYAGVTTTLATTAYPTTQTINIQGWGGGAATKLRAGQFISIGNQLLRIAAVPINADIQGRATIEFNPPLRAQFNAGTNIETAFPQGVFRMTSTDKGSGFQLDPDRAPEFATISAVEAI